jgi:hypothetical protein
VTHRRAGPWTATLAAVALAAGCSTSPDAHDYREQASLTLGTATSEVATVRLVLSELADGDTLRPAAMTQLRYSEDSLGSTAQSFGTLNPPGSADRVHRRSSTLLGEAEDLLAEVRIAVHRESTADYRKLLRDLDALATRLESLERQVAP